MKKFILIILTCFFSVIGAANDKAALSVTEKNIVTTISESNEDALNLLEKLVNINSGTDNIEGVYMVGEIVKKEFEQLGFAAHWEYAPKEMNRAGTLLLTRKGSQGKHLLLIGHLDTVFPKNSPFQHFKQEGNIASGPGVVDDKGGVVLLLYALKALHAQGALDNTTMTIALTGDEENAGSPVAISRAPLLAAAKDVDVALDFEPSATINTATIARRGISNWQITSKGKEAHSSGIFQPGIGYGAIFELTRILDTARTTFANQQYITFNPALIIGGTQATFEENKGSSYGKDNVVPQIAYARGDMRFLNITQLESIKKSLTEIIAKPLAGTSSTITFEDKIPAMSPTSNNEKLLAMYSEVSTDLGYNPVKAIPPQQRGAADISHVAGLIPANLAGLGPVGSGPHSVYEQMDIASLNINTQRAALLIYRLTR